MGAPVQLSAALADRYHVEREIGEGGMATVYRTIFINQGFDDHGRTQTDGWTVRVPVRVESVGGFRGRP